jgi:hypothetical protein
MEKRNEIKTRWQEHERRARNSSLLKGYFVQYQKVSKSTGRRPDYFGYKLNNPKDRIIVDPKWKTKASMNDVKQVLKYSQHPFYAHKRALVYPANVKIPPVVKKEAIRKNVIIAKTKVPKVKEFESGLSGLFKPRVYRR